jgi:signal transduction histidine kinase/HPt (histidine-containing phosphotransfer) domain-containing protein
MQSGRLVRGRHRNGSLLHLEVGISRSRLDDSVQFTAVVRDVSERIAVEAELESHRRSLEELVRRRTAELLQERVRSQTATRAKNEFLARIGHELRTPMNTVLGMSHLLRQQLSGAQATRVVALDNAARQLHGLLEDILDFTRLEAGQLSLAPSRTELRPLLTAVVESSWPAQQPGPDELVLWIDADVPRQVIIDGLRLRQVLGHLLGNALKFTTAGHVTLRVSVADAGREGPVAIRFEVSDTGIGISPAMQLRLFEPFEQADGSDTRGYGGAGIGLVICQRLLALMNVELQVQSEPGRGSRFGFNLKCPVDRDPTPGTRAPFAGRALVLDALADARAAQAESLRTLGYVTDTADDPLTAQRVLRAAAHRGEPVDWVLVGARQAAAAMALPSDALLQGLQPAPRWLLALPAAAAPPLADVLRAGYTGLLDKPVLGEPLAALLRARTPEPVPLPAPAAAPAVPAPAAAELPEPLRRLAQVASLDVALGLRSTLGNPAAYRRLLDSFATFHGADPQRLRDAARDADADRVRAAAHSLTSAAGSIGAQRIQLLSQGLAKRSGALDAEAHSTVAELAGELQALIEALAGALAEGPAVPAPTPPAIDAGARRAELRRHLEGRDMAALRWLQSVGDAELAVLGVPPAPLRHAVMAFDYDAALEMLALAEARHRLRRHGPEGRGMPRSLP